MKIFSWNVRGLNSSGRQNTIRSWLNNLGYSVGAFVETHVAEKNSAALMQDLFRGWSYASNYSEVEGGRIWIVWEQSLSVVVFKKSEQMMVCGVFYPTTQVSLTVGFVYAYNTEGQRRRLWEEIVSLSSHHLVKDRPLLILGDFNQILNATEHFSILPYDLPVRGMDELRDCLVQSELEDLESRGIYFTWSNNRPDDPIIRKLDRAVGNETWRETFPDVVAQFEAPGESDHAPCVVDLLTVSESRKISFKYFSFLSTHPQFLDQVLAAWQKEIAVGSELFSLGQRLKAVKQVCRRLHRVGFGNIQQKTKLAMEELQDIQSEMLVNPTESLFRREFVARKKWKFLDSALQIFFKIKSRIRWLKDGDPNTKFFFKAALAHQARNAIRFLIDEAGIKVTNKAQVKDMVVSYFHHLLGSVSLSTSPPSVNDLQILMRYRCPEELKESLCRLPSAEEITTTLMSMPKSKALGPDGFPAEFFWEAWNVVGSEVLAAVKEFFVGGRMLRKFNATAIALIPKIIGADKLTLFRPISLCSTIYKVIARVLKKKIKLFIEEVVQRNQVGFIQGRLLCENVLLASELVTDFHVKGRVSRGCLKIDLAKAYDNLNWEFLLNLLKAYELPDELIGWIKECITTTSFSVVVNGELHGYFQGKKGLRQGDPVSSLLFVLAMDVLSKMLDQGARNNRFKPYPSCEAPLITHLSFADDVLVFSMDRRNL